MSSRESILNKLRSARQPFEDVKPIAQDDRQPVVPMGDTSPDAVSVLIYHLNKLLWIRLLQF